MENESFYLINLNATLSKIEEKMINCISSFFEIAEVASNKNGLKHLEKEFSLTATIEYFYKDEDEAFSFEIMNFDYAEFKMNHHWLSNAEGFHVFNNHFFCPDIGVKGCNLFYSLLGGMNKQDIDKLIDVDRISFDIKLVACKQEIKINSDRTKHSYCLN